MILQRKWGPLCSNLLYIPSMLIFSRFFEAPFCKWNSYNLALTRRLQIEYEAESKGIPNSCSRSPVVSSHLREKRKFGVDFDRGQCMSKSVVKIVSPYCKYCKRSETTKQHQIYSINFISDRFYCIQVLSYWYFCTTCSRIALKKTLKKPVSPRELCKSNAESLGCRLLDCVNKDRFCNTIPSGAFDWHLKSKRLVSADKGNSLNRLIKTNTAVIVPSKPVGHRLVATGGL